MSKVISRLLVVLAFGWAGSAGATLIDLGTVTSDTDTGLEWLDLDLTVQMTRDQVLASPYVVDEGYRYASLADLNTLYDNAGGNGYYLNEAGVPNLDNYSAAVLLIELMGCTSSVYGQECDGVDQDWQGGMYGAYPGSPELQVSIVDAWQGSWVGNAGAIWTDWWTTVPIETRDGDWGSYLVKNSVIPVPTPETLPLIGLCLAALGYSRRKRKQHI